MKTYYLIFALLPFLDYLTYSHDPRKARRRIIFSLVLLALLTIATFVQATELRTAESYKEQYGRMILGGFRPQICSVEGIISYMIEGLSTKVIAAILVVTIIWIQGIIALADHTAHPLKFCLALALLYIAIAIWLLAGFFVLTYIECTLFEWIF
jgi:hypothetical protein